MLKGVGGHVSPARVSPSKAGRWCARPVRPRMTASHTTPPKGQERTDGQTRRTFLASAGAAITATAAADQVAAERSSPSEQSSSNRDGDIDRTAYTDPAADVPGWVTASMDTDRRTETVSIEVDTLDSTVILEATRADGEEYAGLFLEPAGARKLVNDLLGEIDGDAIENDYV